MIELTRKQRKRLRRTGYAEKPTRVEHTHRLRAMTLPPESLVSVEIMCFALASFRGTAFRHRPHMDDMMLATSDQWQRIGVLGRWWWPWVNLWRVVSDEARDPRHALMVAQQDYMRARNADECDDVLEGIRDRCEQLAAWVKAVDGLLASRDDLRRREFLLYDRLLRRWRDRVDGVNADLAAGRLSLSAHRTLAESLDAQQTMRQSVQGSRREHPASSMHSQPTYTGTLSGTPPRIP